MRLIDADEVFCKDCNLKDTEDCKNCDVHMMPTVDAVPVVRCGECIHQVTKPCVGGTYQACTHEDHEGVDGCYPEIISQDWYCADGERKEVTE